MVFTQDERDSSLAAPFGPRAKDYWANVYSYFSSCVNKCYSSCACDIFDEFKTASTAQQISQKKLKKFEKEYHTLREQQEQQEAPIERYEVHTSRTYSSLHTENLQIITILNSINTHLI